MIRQDQAFPLLIPQRGVSSAFRSKNNASKNVQMYTNSLFADSDFVLFHRVISKRAVFTENMYVVRVGIPKHVHSIL